MKPRTYIDVDGQILKIERFDFKIRYYNQQDVLHRLDGPAVEYWCGEEFWIDGDDYDYYDWLEMIPNKFTYRWKEFCNG